MGPWEVVQPCANLVEVMPDSLRALFAHPPLLGLVLLSTLALGVGLERVLTLWRNASRLRLGHQHILAHLQAGAQDMAQAVNTTSAHHAATPLLGLLLAGRASNSGPVVRAYGQVVRRAQARLWLLGSIASIAPFVGLLGTVLGVMRAFEDINTQGSGGFAVVSGGISEALITTAVGIFVGIEAVLLFNVLRVKAGDYAAQLRDAVDEVSEAWACLPEHPRAN